jgi:hypothetical protein
MRDAQLTSARAANGANAQTRGRGDTGDTGRETAQVEEVELDKMTDSSRKLESMEAGLRVSVSPRPCRR